MSQTKILQSNVLYKVSSISMLELQCDLLMSSISSLYPLPTGTHVLYKVSSTIFSTRYRWRSSMCFFQFGLVFWSLGTSNVYVAKTSYAHYLVGKLRPLFSNNGYLR